VSGGCLAAEMKEQILLLLTLDRSPSEVSLQGLAKWLSLYLLTYPRNNQVNA